MKTRIALDLCWCESRPAKTRLRRARRCKEVYEYILRDLTITTSAHQVEKEVLITTPGPRVAELTHAG
jgi:hypothetical protein